MDKETLITIIREEIQNVLQERSMTDSEIDDREDIVLNLKKKAKDLKKRYGKDWKTKLGYDKLSPGQYQNAMIGGMTATPGVDAAAVLGTAGLIKAAPAALSGLGNLAKNEVSKLTMTDAAFNAGIRPAVDVGIKPAEDNEDEY